MMEEPRYEPHFLIDAVSSGDDFYVTLECQRCIWMAEREVPIDLEALKVEAAEHKCRLG